MNVMHNICRSSVGQIIRSQFTILAMSRLVVLPMDS